MDHLGELAIDACLQLGEARQRVVADVLAHADQRAQRDAAGRGHDGPDPPPDRRPHEEEREGPRPRRLAVPEHRRRRDVAPHHARRGVAPREDRPPDGRERVGQREDEPGDKRLCAYVVPSDQAFAEAVADIPEIVEVYRMSGDVDYLLRVVVPDLESYERFLGDKLTRIPGVGNIQTSFALKPVVYRTELPLGESSGKTVKHSAKAKANKRR